MHSSPLLVVEVILKGTAVLLAGYGGAAWLARSSAAHRSWWWFGVFVTLLLLPLALVVPPLRTFPIHSPALPAEKTQPSPATMSPRIAGEWDARIAPNGPSLTVAGAPVARMSPVSPASSRWHLRPVAWGFIVYAVGAFLVLGFRFLGAWQLSRLCRQSAEDAEAQAIVERWRQSAGLRREVRVYGDARATVPMTWGIGRPVILLPETRSVRPRADLEAALRHEFAHVCHHDALRRWLGTIVAALWWPHPLVWLAGRRWKLEQECACDDAVLVHGGDAESYAQQLITAARGSRPAGARSAAALIMAAPAGLEARLRAVMSTQVNRSPARTGALLRIGALTLAATLGSLVFQTRNSVAAPPAPPAAEATADAMQQMAEKTIIPKFEYYEVTPAAALETVGKALGVRISYTPRPDDRANLSFSLTNVPAAEALRYVANLAYLKVTYQADDITVVADKAPPVDQGALEKKAQGIHLPKLNFKNATPAEVLQTLSKASGIKVVYTPAEWDQPNQTFTYYENAPASDLFFDFSQRANLYMTYREDAIYFVANPYARDNFRTPGTVEYTAEMTVIPRIDWKPMKPAEAFRAIAAASGIKIFYTPCQGDRLGPATKLANASVAFLVQQYAYSTQFGARISYAVDAIHLEPGNSDLNAEHASRRFRRELPMPRDLALEESPEFKAARERNLTANNALIQQKHERAALVHVGDAAPDFTCRTTTGAEIALSQMKGKVVVLHFFVNNQWAWDTVQKFEKELHAKYGDRADLQALAVFKMEAPKLDAVVQQKSISCPTAADPKNEIGAKFARDSGTTYVIGKDGKIKQCATSSLIYEQAAPTAGDPPPQPGMTLAFTAETMDGVNRTLQRELAANP